MEQRITIGKILKPHGLYGEVKVLPLTDVADRFDLLTTVSIHPMHGQDVMAEVEEVRYYKGHVYLRFLGRESREAIEPLVNGLLQIEQSQVPDLPDGVYYHFEIIDSVVYTDNGIRLGTVVDIMETGGNDVYVIQGGTREYLVPATEGIIKQVDREKRMIVIHPLEGLLDL